MTDAITLAGVSRGDAVAGHMDDAHGVIVRHRRGPNKQFKMTRLPDTRARQFYEDALLVQRQPDDLAGDVAGVATRRLGKSIGQLPLLLLVAPLRGRLRNDIVGAAMSANRRRSRRPRPAMPRFLRALLKLFLFRMKRVEEKRMCHFQRNPSPVTTLFDCSAPAADVCSRDEAPP